MPDQESTRRTVVIGNWKMHKTGAEGAALAAGIVAGLRPGRAEVAVAPPFTALAPVADAIRGSSVALAAQDVFHEREGAFTGAVSAPMLAAAGCSIVLAGHSERRHVFGDGDEDVRRKALAVLDAGMRPVVCVGETAGQRDAGQAEDVVREQLEAVVRGLSDARLARSHGRLRAGLGHRHRPDRDPGHRGSHAPRHPCEPGRARGTRSGRTDAHPLRRVGEGR